MRMERVYAVTSQRVSSLLQQLSGGSVDEDNTGDWFHPLTTTVAICHMGTAVKRPIPVRPG